MTAVWRSERSTRIRRQVRKPVLLVFHSPTSGRCRRVDGYLAQVLQRRHNHDTFDLRRIDYDANPDLAGRLQVGGAPTILVLEGRHVRARLDQPRGPAEIQTALAPWLR